MEPKFDKQKLTLIKKKGNLLSSQKSHPIEDLSESEEVNANQQSKISGDERERRKSMEDMKQNCSSTAYRETRIPLKSSSVQPNQSSLSSAVVVASSTGKKKSSSSSSAPSSSSSSAGSSSSQSRVDIRKGETQIPPLLPSSNGKLVIQWTCDECHHSCIPVRSESRCLCGHRYKEHKFGNNSSGKCQCRAKNCSCQHFYFIVAEGAWILRCRCKHKHIEHDPGHSPFLCKKSGCNCSGFDSPWVCNCGHAWSNHTQSTIQQQQQPLQLLSDEDLKEGMVEAMSTVMAADSMNDMSDDMMYRRDGEIK